MPKNQTNWTNNDDKPITPWADNDVRNQTDWENNVSKNPTAYIETEKNETDWISTNTNLESWLYDDPTMRYDDMPVRGYDYLVPATNQLNTKNQTAWEQVV